MFNEASPSRSDPDKFFLTNDSTARDWVLRSNSVRTFDLFFFHTSAPFRAPPCAVYSRSLRGLWHRVIGPHLRRSATTSRENGNALRAAKVSRDVLTTTSRPSSSPSVAFFSSSSSSFYLCLGLSWTIAFTTTHVYAMHALAWRNACRFRNAPSCLPSSGLFCPVLFRVHVDF